MRNLLNCRSLLVFGLNPKIRDGLKMTYPFFALLTMFSAAIFVWLYLLLPLKTANEEINMTFESLLFAASTTYFVPFSLMVTAISGCCSHHVLLGFAAT